MSDSREKYLSALLDGVQEPLNARERDQLVADALTELASDSALKESYERQQMISAVLKGETDGLTNGIVSGTVKSRIMQAIQRTPAHDDLMTDAVVNLSSRVAETDRVQAHPDSVAGEQLSTVDSPLQRRGRTASNDDVNWWRPAAAFAVAASVVAVALFAWNPSDVTLGTSQTDGVSITTVDVSGDGKDKSGTTPDLSAEERIAASPGAYDVFSTPGTVWASVTMDNGNIEVDSHVDGAGQSYLNMLLVEHGSATTMNGLSTYAKFVSFDASPSR